MTTTLRRSRLRAFAYAVALGMALGCGIGLALLLPVAYGEGSYWGGNESPGILAGLSMALPGVTMLGMIFTVPSALLLVLPLAGLERSGLGWALHPLAWGVWGALCAVPQAWLFGAGFNETLFEVPSAHMILLAIGLVCGLAGRWGYREVAEELSKNPSTIA